MSAEQLVEASGNARSTVVLALKELVATHDDRSPPGYWLPAGRQEEMV
jgi:hypothetical protein